jgi:hypothetical protein
MSAHGRVTLTLAALLCATVLTGLLWRRRADRCYSLLAYLVAMVAYQPLVLLWPAIFWEYSFYVRKEATLNVLKLAIAGELAWRSFRLFPGALARVRVLIGPAILIAFLLIPTVFAGDPAAVISTLNARVQFWTVVAFCLTGIFVGYYRLPIGDLQRAVVLGMATYLGVFAGLLELLRVFGFDSARVAVSLANGWAYSAMLVWWARVVWRRQEEPGLTPELVALLRARAHA